MKPRTIEHNTWLELSQAADFLGVHFTTLRRWADAGKVPYMRTPGGRRRFSVTALEQFVQSRLEGSSIGLAVSAPENPLEQRAIAFARQSVSNLTPAENWLGKMSEAQRLSLKGTGRQLMALLLQYNGRVDGGEAFLDEGRRIISEYSAICLSVGFSLQETVHAFLFFRRSILDAIHETGYLSSGEDYEGQRIYQRTTDFLDVLLLDLIDRYLHVQAQISE